MRLLPTSLIALVSIALASAQESQTSCGTVSQPNPIASQYYANITGTLNGTLAILPIPLSLARKIIPPQYEILTEQYRALLPNLPEDTYPALLQAVFDHDIRYMEYSMPDFSRASIEFPFISYFSDPTPFRYVPDMLMTSTNEMGINASREYGGVVFPATFTPSCDAYARTADGGTSYSAEAGEASLTSLWTETNDSAAAGFPMSFFRQTLNQPIFGIEGMCNHQIRLFDSALSVGEFAPRKVEGSVTATVPGVFEGEMRWEGAVGLQIDTPFIERHMVACEELRGWRYDDESEGGKGLVEGEGFVEKANQSFGMGEQMSVLGIGAMVKRFIMGPGEGRSEL